MDNNTKQETELISVEENGSPEVKTMSFKLKELVKIDKYMLPCKVTYFFTLGKDASFHPYILPFLIGTGLSTKQAGLISGIRVIGMILGGLLWGYIGDKRKNHKQIMIILIAMSLIFISGQPLVSIFVGDKKKNICQTVHKNAPSSSSSNSSSTFVEIQENDGYSSMGFFVMLFLNIIGSFFDGSILNMVDTGVVQRISNAETKKEFGWNRLFGSFGYAFGSFFGGLATDYFPNINVNCFTAAYCLYAVLSIAAGISSFFLFQRERVQEEDHLQKSHEETVKVRRTVLKTLKDVEVVMFLVTVFILGFLYSIYVSFTSLRLREVNTPTYMIGITFSVGSLSCVPVLIFSSRLIALIGGVWNSITLSCLSYVFRLFVFAYAENPWMFTAVNTLNGLSFGLSTVSFVLYIKNVSLPQIYTSMISIMNVIFYGIAFITANIGGGYIFNRYQGKILFAICGGIASVWTVCLILFILIKRTLLKKKKTSEKTNENLLNS